MARYIDADALIKNIANITDLRRLSTKTVGIAISATPTADVVEVVRCKDCKWYKTDTDYCKEHHKGYCEWDNTVKSQKHFCSYGEKRDAV